jgi:general secretion pathway protein I
MNRSRNRQRGFTLLEVLVATIILAVAVSALLSNLSVSTGNLFKASSVDRLTFLSKRKMDELIAIQNLPRGAVMEGALEIDPESKKPLAGFRAEILPAGAISPNAQERLEHIVLETWLDTGSGRRRTLQLESYRTVRFQ